MELYEAIHTRRDIRRFKPDLIPKDVITRILDAAHHAGSVGLMQPWNFILIEDVSTRYKVKHIFEEQNAVAAQNYIGNKQNLYRSLKLEGILESPLNLCVTCDRTRKGPHVLGRNSMIDTDIYSTCCAIQNLWLAARAEKIGVGWVSIIEPQTLQDILNIPSHVLPIAYLCIGYPVEFGDKPMLQEVGWENRIPLQDLIYFNSWGNPWDEK